MLQVIGIVTQQYLNSDCTALCCCLELVRHPEGVHVQWKVGPDTLVMGEEGAGNTPQSAGAAEVRYRGHHNAIRSLCYHDGFLFSGSLVMIYCVANDSITSCQSRPFLYVYTHAQDVTVIVRE